MGAEGEVANWIRAISSDLDLDFEKRIRITIEIRIRIRIKRRTMNPDETWFAHEKLDVYQEAIAFVAWLSNILDKLDRIGDVKDQLDRASTSVVLNIAEGNGKYGPKDRCRFFDTAHASALECAGGLDVLVAKRRLTIEQIRTGKEHLQRMVRMLMGLIKKNSTREYEKGPQLTESDRTS